jgi:multisubunit Na+/H+ antiporter MnhE subunit
MAYLNVRVVDGNDDPVGGKKVTISFLTLSFHKLGWKITPMMKGVFILILMAALLTCMLEAHANLAALILMEKLQ